MKRLINKVLNKLGYQLSKTESKPAEGLVFPHRMGRMDYFLEDLRNRGLKCQSILDVGTNASTWSRMAKNVFPEAYFTLIEPQIEMEHHLKAFTAEFPNSTYFLNGAGPEKGTLTLTVWDDLAGSSFLPQENDVLLASEKQRKIEIVTIDDLLEKNNIPQPEIIKLDIQGFELEALKGAEKTFGFAEAYLLEVSLFPFSDAPGMPVIAEVIQFMLERGYVVYDFPGFLRRPLDGALGQCDICFVKKDGFLRASNDWK